LKNQEEEEEEEEEDLAVLTESAMPGVHLPSKNARHHVLHPLL
jgi:hypothetical protein